LYFWENLWSCTLKTLTQYVYDTFIMVWLLFYIEFITDYNIGCTFVYLLNNVKTKECKM